MVEKISKYTLWAGMGISIVILILFYLIGFDRVFEEEPDFNDPQLTDVLLIWTYFLTAVACVVAVWSVIHGLTTKGTGTSKDTGMAGHTSSIAWGITFVSVVLGVIVGFMSKGETLLINGKAWNDSFDIIITDTCMISILILTIVTVIVTAWSMITNKN